MGSSTKSRFGPLAALVALAAGLALAGCGGDGELRQEVSRLERLVESADAKVTELRAQVTQLRQALDQQAENLTSLPARFEPLEAGLAAVQAKTRTIHLLENGTLVVDAGPNRFQVQADGDVAVYSSGQVLWAAGTNQP